MVVIKWRIERFIRSLREKYCFTFGFCFHEIVSRCCRTYLKVKIRLYARSFGDRWALLFVLNVDLSSLQHKLIYLVFLGNDDLHQRYLFAFFFNHLVLLSGSVPPLFVLASLFTQYFDCLDMLFFLLNQRIFMIDYVAFKRLRIF